MAIPESKLKELRDFITLVKSKPSIVHLPELAFFKEYLQSVNATLPPNPASNTAGGCGHGCSHDHGHAKPKATPPPKAETKATDGEDSISEDEPTDAELDIDMEAVNQGATIVPRETTAFPPQPTNSNPDREMTDAEMEEVSNLKSQVQDAIEDGNKDKALELLNKVITIAPPSTLQFTKRAELLLKLNRPAAAIFDCDKALEINSSSAKALRIKGKAHAMLGEWVAAHKAISESQAADYDEELHDLEKDIEKRWKLIDEKSKKRDRELDAVRHRNKLRGIRRRRRLADKYKTTPNSTGGGFPAGGFPGGDMPGAGGDFNPAGLFSQMLGPEADNPKVQAALMEVMSNPQDISVVMKHMSDPEVAPVLQKLMGMMGGMMGGAGGAPGGAGFPFGGADGPE